MSKYGVLERACGVFVYMWRFIWKKSAETPYSIKTPYFDTANLVESMWELFFCILCVKKMISHILNISVAPVLFPVTYFELLAFFQKFQRFSFQNPLPKCIFELIIPQISMIYAGNMPWLSFQNVQVISIFPFIN